MVAVALMIAAPQSVAQFSDFTNKPAIDESAISTPGFLNFCAGDPCPGQTCDALNNKCVGNVTLQPKVGEPLVGLSAAELARFEEGKVLYDVDFVASEGLGPVFNQTGCGSCHSNPLGGSGSISVTRFGEITVVGTDFVFNPLAEFGGSLLNKESISAECAELIPVPPTNTASQRLTNSALGFGLVELIPSADIEFNAINPPAGVSGKAIVVPVLENPGETTIGRFGWKDQLGTVASFTADAMLQEMGITNRIFPEDNPPNNDFVRLAACDTVADPEDVPNANGDDFLDLTTDFQRFLAAPPQTPRSGMTGEALFFQVGCGDCHMAGFSTPLADGDDESSDALAGKTVNAYSDFLLHDMGGSGDYVEQGDAGLTELRTALLWGLRIRDPLWHDGRVAGGTFDFRIFNAVMLHDAFGSESQASAQAYFALSASERDQIIAFLDSLGRREFDLDGNGLVNDADVLLIDDCVATGGPFTADDLCAIADVDQNGFIDVADLELLNVALGVVDQNGDDEDEDEDSDNDGGGDGSLRSRFIADGRGNSGGNQVFDGKTPAEQSQTANPFGGSDLDEGERQQQRADRRHSMRRGR
jgi:CxxC motif-containing protein (DUF1111 family)